jgi:hypothetical protein
MNHGTESREVVVLPSTPKHPQKLFKYPVFFSELHSPPVFPVTLAQSSVHFYLSTLLHLLHQKKLFERKFVLLFNILLFFNGSTAILPSSAMSIR